MIAGRASSDYRQELQDLELDLVEARQRIELLGVRKARLIQQEQAALARERAGA